MFPVISSFGQISPPNLIAPPNGSFQTGVVTLQWSSVPGARAYSVFIQLPSSSGWLTSDVTSTSKSFNPTYTGSVNGEYHWKIKSQASNFTYGDDSEIWSFNWSDGGEIISSCSPPYGPLGGNVGQNLTYSTTPGTSNLGHEVECQFDWGDGTLSDWDGPSQRHSYSNIGTYTIKVHARCKIHTDILSSWSVGTVISINDINPIVLVTPSKGEIGTTFNRSGSGFTPNGQVEIRCKYPNNYENVTNKTLSSTGSFSDNWQSPNNAQVGTYEYWAIDLSSGNISNEVNFQIIFPTNPVVSANPSDGPRGTTFNLYGTGFTPNSTAEVHFKFPDNSEQTFTKNTDGGGVYPYSWTAPNDAQIGTYKYWAKDLTSEKTSNTVSFQVISSANPQVSVSPNNGPQGTTFNMLGTGFTPGGIAEIHYNNPNGIEFTPLNKSINNDGTYSNSWQSPSDASLGTYQHWSIDLSSGKTSSIVNFQVTAASLSAPSNLVALADGSSVNLTWQDNSSNEQGFKIERKTGDSGSWSQIATRSANSTSWKNTSLSLNKKYYYRVRAYNSASHSSYSNSYYAFTMQGPSNLDATAVSSSQINLTWSDRSTNETGFKIERKVSGGSWTEIGYKPSGQTSYQDTGLSSAQTYYYRVRAYHNSGQPIPHYSSFSSEANAKTFDPLSNPGSITGGVRDANNNNPIGGASVRLKQGSITKYETSSASNGTYTISNVIPGTYTLLVLRLTLFEQHFIT